MKPAWQSGFTERSREGTVWCMQCARVGMHTPAAGTVDDDPHCGNCGPRIAAQSGYPWVVFASTPALNVAAPAPEPTEEPVPPPIDVPQAIAEPIQPATPQPIQEEPPVKLSPKDILEIKAADDSVTNAELARKYGVTDVSIHYHRRGAGTKTKSAAKKSAAPKKHAAQVASQLPPPESNRGELLGVIVDNMTEVQADALWGILPLADKSEALRGILLARLER